MKGSAHKVLLISGSLRKNSVNSGLLRAVVNQKHPDFDFEWANISEVPLFNEDIEVQGVPQSIKRIRDQANKSDAILFGIPENNFSFSAPLKNVYDWLSRQYPNDPSPVQEKIGGMISAGGGKGGARAQAHFYDSVKFRKMKMMHPDQAKVQVMRWGQDGERFDGEGNLNHEETRKELTPFLNEFSKWIASNKV